MNAFKATHAVDEALFREVYDSPASLPGRHRWVTPDQDVRQLEAVLGIPDGAIGAPLWVSGDQRECLACGRLMSWLDIVSSALDGVHGQAMIAKVILGSQRFVNTEAPRAIAGVRCFDCNADIRGLRSFKCHNWAYAMPALRKVLGDKLDAPRRDVELSAIGVAVARTSRPADAGR
jgi:hypothetical protein